MQSGAPGPLGRRGDQAALYSQVFKLSCRCWLRSSMCGPTRYVQREPSARGDECSQALRARSGGGEIEQHWKSRAWFKLGGCNCPVAGYLVHPVICGTSQLTAPAADGRITQVIVTPCRTGPAAGLAHKGARQRDQPLLNLRLLRSRLTSQALNLCREAGAARVIFRRNFGDPCFSLVSFVLLHGDISSMFPSSI